MMKFFQKLGKSLMLPVACLPVCGILMGIGYILAPAAMAGEVQGFTAGGLSYSIGLFLIKAGGALIDNMSWLFAVGVAVGMAQDNDGTAGLAGLVSMYMITTLLSSGAVAGITGKEAAPAFAKIVNQFVGILSGLIGSYCYNKYRTVKLPDALAFFSGKRAVAIFTALYSILAADPVLHLAVSIRRSGKHGRGIYRHGRDWSRYLRILQPSADPIWSASCIKLCILV